MASRAVRRSALRTIGSGRLAVPTFERAVKRAGFGEAAQKSHLCNGDLWLAEIARCEIAAQAIDQLNEGCSFGLQEALQRAAAHMEFSRRGRHARRGRRKILGHQLLHADAEGGRRGHLVEQFAQVALQHRAEARV
jgi:hypothetical protein